MHILKAYHTVLHVGNWSYYNQFRRQSHSIYLLLQLSFLFLIIKHISFSHQTIVLTTNWIKSQAGLWEISIFHFNIYICKLSGLGQAQPKNDMKKRKR